MTNRRIRFLFNRKFTIGCVATTVVLRLRRTCYGGQAAPQHDQPQTSLYEVCHSCTYMAHFGNMIIEIRVVTDRRPHRCAMFPVIEQVAHSKCSLFENITSRELPQKGEKARDMIIPRRSHPRFADLVAMRVEADNVHSICESSQNK